MARMIAVLLSVCCMLATLSARADERLGLSFTSSVSGKEMPAIVIQPTQDVRSITVSLKRNDGRALKVSAFGVKAGTTKKLAVRQEPGTFTYNGKFDVKWAEGEPSKFDMRFTMTRVTKLELTIEPEDVDLDARVMSFKISNPAKHATLEIYGKDRKKIAEVDQDFGNAKPGSALTIKWKDPGRDVLYMDLKVYDVAGFWKGVRLTPFTISIKHDDVEFEFGKWAIRKSEEHKLEATMSEIKKALAEHGTLLTLKLYVAGYTDTVGSESSNQRLSNNRARSIASWFRRHGLKIPIFYQGFGEKVLAKSTPDETPEPANRRALYILSSQKPSGGPVPKDNWREIK